ncbi:YcaO-like family protein [Nocardia abscessus]|uniref:YcaO-like family protein n=1 Tax=Nocardia abscessus TaxID=120957 RepID=UPI002458DEC9|nr:YcaO-like family protein [Nocardia abscessus]
MPDVRVDLPGTYRAREPEQTWELVAPLLSDFGITRVAEVTDFDCIGIPVVMATRPMSETLVVSQGKGMTPLLARLSAVMECIELDHAERPAAAAFSARADELALTYDIGDLQLRVDAQIVRQLDLEWYHATTLVSATPSMIPRGLVDLTFGSGYDWRPGVFRTSSTGLASGNTLDEALLHAMYELIERDAVSSLSSATADSRRLIDVSTVDSEHCQELFEKLRRAGVQFETAIVPNPFRIPTAVAFVWSEDFALTCAGSGAHSDPAVALSRAVTEAVQSRLTEIVGTRDDIPSDGAPALDARPPVPPLSAIGLPWAEAVADEGLHEDSFAKERAAVAKRIADHTGREPIWMDLSTRPEVFSVVRAFAPGLVYSARGHVPR